MDKNFQKNTLMPCCALAPIGRLGFLTQHMQFRTLQPHAHIPPNFMVRYGCSGTPHTLMRWAKFRTAP